MDVVRIVAREGDVRGVEAQGEAAMHPQEMEAL